MKKQTIILQQSRKSEEVEVEAEAEEVERMIAVRVAREIEEVAEAAEERREICQQGAVAWVQPTGALEGESELAVGQENWMMEEAAGASQADPDWTPPTNLEPEDTLLLLSGLDLAAADGLDPEEPGYE